MLMVEERVFLRSVWGYLGCRKLSNLPRKWEEIEERERGGDIGCKLNYFFCSFLLSTATKLMRLLLLKYGI